MVSVEQWAEVRRMRFVEGLAIREIRRRTGLHRETIRRALSSSTPPGYSRAARGSKLDRLKDQVHELLREDPEIESQRIRELLIESGFEGGKTIVDDYVREVRLFFVDRRTFQRTVYRPADVMQFDLWQPKREIPVGYGQTRRAMWSLVCLALALRAGALVFWRRRRTCCGGCGGRHGPLRVPQRPAIVIPRPARTLHRIEAGDHVLLAAAPAYDVVIVHTLSALDDMLASYHSTHATGIPAT